MRNKKLIPFEIIEKAVAGEPEAVNAVLYHYRGYIKYRSVFQRHFDTEFLPSSTEAMPSHPISE